ncbi:hypothetical protein F5890DRAFT_1300047 [Lentinula detonsa]|uniref:Uncharacterized protein n=1 Tax=Lentinula detonsa TaxID=2804962 RepID=A0AA38Q0D2_9AGAR|nr:hypothetical protein F5890DRAFT_1300047 [Lentinula detonsa]
MKSFFQRKNDSQAGVSKSALSKDPYRIWMPRQESDSSQKPLERTEKREGRSSTRESQKPRSSSRAPRPTDTTTTNSATHRSHRHPITPNPITTHKEDAFRNPVNPTPVPPTVNSMQSQRVAQASSINSKPTAPEPFTSSMDATYSPHPSVRTANVAKTYAGSTFNGIYPTASTSASAAIRPEMAKASSSYSKRDGEPIDRHGDRTRDRSERDRVRERDYDKVKEKERTRDRMERNKGTERERDRAKDRDSEREGERVRDRNRDRDRDKYRERDREKERERDKDRTRLRTDPLAYVEPIPSTERGHRERDRQRDTDSVFRASVRDKERTRYRERDIPRNDERSVAYDSGREKLISKDIDKFRESSRRPDWEQQRRTDAGRSSRHRKTEREQDPVKNFAVYQKATGKESSDEAENSDASKNKYSSAYRRTKVKDPIPSALPPSLGQSYLPTSTDPTTYGSFAAPSFNQDSTPHNTYPTPSSSKANQDSARYNSALSTSKHNQDPVHYGRPPIPPASKPINDSATSQTLFSPEPLPIRLPTRITESSLFREPPIPLRPPLDGTATTSNEAKRSERYNSSTARSRDKVQDSTNNVPLIQQRDTQGQRKCQLQASMMHRVSGHLDRPHLRIQRNLRRLNRSITNHNPLAPVLPVMSTQVIGIVILNHRMLEPLRLAVVDRSKSRLPHSKQL